MKIRKGDYGYIRREKKKRLLVTLGLFVLPAIVFIVGLVLADEIGRASCRERV